MPAAVAAFPGGHSAALAADTSSVPPRPIAAATIMRRVAAPFVISVMSPLLNCAALPPRRHDPDRPPVAKMPAGDAFDASASCRARQQDAAQRPDRPMGGGLDARRR